MPLTFSVINESIAKVVQTKEAELQTVVTGITDTSSTADLLKMQTQLQQWTMTTQIQSSLVKEVGDALKGIIQKAG